MIPEYKRVIKTYLIGIVWLFGLLWPLLGIHSDGTLSFRKAFTVWGYIAGVALVGVVLYLLKKDKRFQGVSDGWGKFRSGVRSGFDSTPKWLWMTAMMAVLLYYPNFDFIGRYQTDIAIMVLVYVCLGLGLNIVVGLAGLLDLGYIAFYGVGAYTYALLSIHYQLSFWLALPLAGGVAAIAGCIVGYPTLRMRGDYLAIVTLGFGEIVRLILNNWMDLTNGPNGILGIKPPGLYYPSFVDGFSLEHLWLKKLQYLYYVILFLAIVTIVAVHRLNYSRIGRAWEAIREDETAAELMGVNTFKLKLLAYAMGAIFGGLAGAFFSARMRFVSPESFTFIESAMVLAMVVLGGMASIPGILLGTAALIILPEVFRGFELYRMLAFGAAMTLMMLFRPAGLIPNKRVGKRSEEKEE